MAYVIPTVETFMARFPIFSDKDETVVGMIIAEAAGKVDNTWIESDYQPAILYLAAHMLATDNSDEGGQVQIGESDTILSESFGGMSVSYGKASAGGASASAMEAEYSKTSYGRRYLGLLRNNFPAIVSI